MAIKPKPKFQQSSSPLFNTPASGNPPPFRATGWGWFNNYPDFAANSNNANASLTNLATSKSNGDKYKIYLWVSSVETGWQLSGETGQAAGSRVFYPRNLTQNEFVVVGQVASQFEYDKIVEFVEHHHYSQITPQGALAQSYDGNNYPSVDFILFKPTNTQTFDAYAPIHYSVLITNIEAGHERFQNYPTYQLTCKVVYDYIGPRYEIEQDITKRVSRQSVFGTTTSPVDQANSGGSSKQTTSSNQVQSTGSTGGGKI